MADDSALIGRLREGLALGAPDGVTEADTRQRLIDPVVAWLGYDERRVRLESHAAGNRPDYLLYAGPLTEGGPAQAVVEAKQLGADFDRVTAADRTESPDRQARRYLRDHAESGPGTAGALTDGLRWRIYRKEPGGGIGAEALDIDIGPLVRGEDDSLEALGSLREALARGAAGAAGGAGERALRAIAAAVRDGSAEDAVRALGAVSDPLDPIAAASLTGRDLDGFLEDWDSTFTPRARRSTRGTASRTCSDRLARASPPCGSAPRSAASGAGTRRARPASSRRGRKPASPRRSSGRRRRTGARRCGWSRPSDGTSP